MTINSNKELEALKEVGRVVATVRDEILKNIRPGITTGELDDIGGKLFEQYGARSAPMKDYDFPGFTCISINDEIAHGVPGSRIVKSGDMVNVDVSAELGGYYADTGASIVVEKGVPLSYRLCECAEKALYKAIHSAKAGKYLNSIGAAIEKEAKSYGFKVVENLSGHGIGRKLHEDPDYIFNYYDQFDKRVLVNGIVLAVETFITDGVDYVVQDHNGWVLRTPNKRTGAQFEHTIVVTKGDPIILTVA